MARKAFVFLNGHYHKNDSRLFSRLFRDNRSKPLLVAVDGGLAFMQKTNIVPAYWLTDLDSSPRIQKGFLKDTESIIHSPDKDKTDGELALDFCLERGIKDISFFGWYDLRCETDHLLGNLMLFRKLRNRSKKTRLRFVDDAQEIYPLRDQNLILKDHKGFRLSVLPIDKTIALTLSGTAFPARNLKIREGQTIALRNRITAERAGIKVQGAALAIIGKKLSRSR